MPQDWNAPQHQWPSAELVAAVNAPDAQAARTSIASAVWNALSSFGSIAYMVEGGYTSLADSKGKLHEFFADRICPAVGLPEKGEPSEAFGRLLLRDLGNSIRSSGAPYGPPAGRNTAYFTLSSRGDLLCQADVPGMARHRIPGVAEQKVA